MSASGSWHQPAGAGAHTCCAARVRPARIVAALGLCAAVVMSACGKKGPPLVPLVTLPAAAENVAARRLESQVFLQFKVPAANSSGSRPADLREVEIYAHTGRLESPADYLVRGALVGTVQVKQPVSDAEEKPTTVMEPGVEQGAVVTWVETLTPAMLILPTVTSAATLPEVVAPPPTVLLGPDDQGPPVPAALVRTAVAAAVTPQPTPGRFYVAVGVNRRGRRGALSTVAGVPVVGPPPPPTAVQMTYTAETITMKWSPSAVETDAPVTSAYNIYEIPAAKADTARKSTEPQTPTPLNASPVTSPSFEDARVEFGTERCYVVRAVTAVGDLAVESEPAPIACVKLVDTFPPAAPRSLAAVSSATAISLIWEANTEKDLGGYLVLRGEAPGEKLAALMPAPIHETTYHDAAVRQGVTYVYVLVAVDTAKPPNASDPSNRVEEVVR